MSKKNAQPKNVIAERVERLDRYLASLFPAWSRTRLQKLIEGGHVKIRGKVTSPHVVLKVGQTIDIDWPVDKPAVAAVPIATTELPVLFEDDSLLIINKPAGIVVHPSAGHFDGNTVMEILRPKFSAGAWLDQARPGLVHRLDRDTSGVMALAKDPDSQNKLSKQFSLRQVKKTYVCLVQGHVKAQEGSLESNMGRHPSQRQRFAVTSTGRWALTKFIVKERFKKEASLVEVHPLTGRTHQIRVHLADYGHPILGDHVYGTKLAEFDFIKRQMLHAQELKLTHPQSGEKLEFQAPLPVDFQEALKLIRLNE